MMPEPGRPVERQLQGSRQGILIPETKLMTVKIKRNIWMPGDVKGKVKRIW